MTFQDCDPLALVRDFHAATGAAICAPDTPGLAELRCTLLREETREACDALIAGDPLAIARELADVVYVAYGAAISYGIDLNAAVAEVHRANMSKLDDNGRPVVRADGKVLKGPNFRPPDMRCAVAGWPCANSRYSLQVKATEGI